MREGFLNATETLLDRCRHLKHRIKRQTRPRAAILAYHRVGEPVADRYGQAVSPENFARHLHHLQTHYCVTSLNELLQQLAEGNYRDGTVAVTFDDGYADNLTLAYPIARQFNTPFTVFVTAQPVIQGAPFWWDELEWCALQRLVCDTACLRVNSNKLYTFSMENETERRSSYDRLHSIIKILKAPERELAIEQVRSWVKSPSCGQPDVGLPLTPAQLRELARLPGVSIGSHTMTHPVLRALPAEEQRLELASSKKMLEELLCQPVTAVAYPFGKSIDLSRKTCRLAANAGYQAAFTTIASPITPSSSRYFLPRLTIHDWPEEGFAQRLRQLFSSNK
jgi:peptidoglycan/xylan/chitin deacetylase (PgdA/CDA1 family)